MAFLEKDIFTTVIRSTPLVSIDLIVEDSQGNVLLGMRNNRPAKGYWFVPGGRILKDETMQAAFTRLTETELGVKLKLNDATFIGPYQHFYQDYVFGDDVSTHYVVLAYRIVVGREELALPREQHSQYKWFTKKEISECPNVHVHSKWYFNSAAE